MPSTGEIHGMISYLLKNAPPVEEAHSGNEPMITTDTCADFEYVLQALLTHPQLIGNFSQDDIDEILAHELAHVVGAARTYGERLTYFKFGLTFFTQPDGLLELRSRALIERDTTGMTEDQIGEFDSQIYVSPQTIAGLDLSRTDIEALEKLGYTPIQ